MVTPIRRWEFILGKTIPYFLIGSVDATVLALIGTFWFGVPFRGHVISLAIVVMTFLTAALGLGLLISTVAAAACPCFFQRLSYINPLRHVALILRSIYLKGVGLDVLWPNVAAMAFLALLMLGVSILRFHKSLE